MSQDLLDHPAQAQFASDEPRHYDRVPSIIDHLTYIHEVKDDEDNTIGYERRRLTPIEKELYRILRYRAGSGACWRTCEDLAEHVGCGKNTITEAKKVLAGAFEQLEGDSLIRIEERHVRTEREGDIINKRLVHVITICNIWPYNNAFMDRLDHKNLEFAVRKQPLSKEEGELAIEKLGQKGPVKFVREGGAHPQLGICPKGSSLNRDLPRKGSSLNRDLNKDNKNKDHCLETDPTANALARCFLASPNVAQSFTSTHDALDSLQRFGFKPKVANKLVKDYSLDDLLLSAFYVKSAMEKKMPESILGYFILTLQKKWYIPKAV